MVSSVSKDLSGVVFDRWLVLRLEDRTDLGEPRWRCRCACGVERSVSQGSLRKGRSKSCGCLKREQMVTHGQSQIGTMYTIWYNFVQRCTNSEHPRYADYGGRGITVCDRWLGENGVKNFVQGMGQRPAGLTLDRIDNDKGYAPANCRWATYSMQNLNKRTNRKTRHAH